MNCIEQENWSPIPDYEGLYEVSDLGRIKSLPRERRTGLGVRMVRERILRLKPGEYPTVSLRKLGDPKTNYVHALVLRAFIGPCPVGMEGCHGDGNKWNCRLSNLRWDTRAGNHADRVLHGVSNRGERCGTAKLKNEDVIQIREARASGVTQSQLAAQFGVSRSQISHIVNGKRWV